MMTPFPFSTNYETLPTPHALSPYDALATPPAPAPASPQEDPDDDATPR
jgi:hypothetical protein